MDKKNFKNQVLKGLLCCQVDHKAFDCNDCPYDKNNNENDFCIQELLADAYRLINKGTQS